MEGDRWSFLAVQAYVQKILTFSAVERCEERWELREQILLEEIDRQRDIELRKLLYNGWMLSAQDQSAYDSATNQYNHFYSLLLPYDGQVAQDKGNLFARMIEMHKLIFGDKGT